MKYLFFSLFSISLSLYGQPGWYVDLAWEVRTTTMNYAYGSYLDDGNGNFEMEFHKDGFFSNQIFGHVGYWGENNFVRADLAGIFYLIGAEIGAKNGTGIAKGKFRNFDKFVEEHPALAIPKEYTSDGVHPITGGGDIRLIDVIGAWGNEKMKFGAHLAYGFLGANAGSNGLSFSNGPIEKQGVQSFNLGFWEYGINGMLHPIEDTDAYINLRISRLSRVSNRFEKRNGVGIELEGQYRFGSGKLQPYLMVRYQLRRMKKGELDYFNAAPEPIELPALTSHTLAIGVGFSFTYSEY